MTRGEVCYYCTPETKLATEKLFCELELYRRRTTHHYLFFEQVL
jgi:hypothetical protein